MSTFLFDQTIFGPIISRRLGVSLGINLLPNDSKLCSFDCIYCECGWNPEKGSVKAVLPTRTQVKDMLEKTLQQMVLEKRLPDVITFAGNGEPTLHPKFAEIVADTLELRDRYSPKARIAVLSNATMLHKKSVIEALKKVDDNILKLDSANVETIKILDQPVGRFDLDAVVKNLSLFEGTQIIQTMLIKGSYRGHQIDNTTEEEVLGWITLLKKIKPRSVMIYTIARDTPATGLLKIDSVKMEEIAKRVREETGLIVQVSS